LTRVAPRRYLWPTTNGREPAISLDFLIWAPVLLFSMVAHEYAHAEAAYRQGDDTAYVLGRLTMNPLKHIDPFMTVLLPILLWVSSGHRWTFGAARPVPVNPRKYRHYVRGDVIVSLAGIATNLALFLVFTGAFALVGVVGRGVPALSDTMGILQRMAGFGMWFNLILAFFNLIPIPPLDGSHVFYHLLPPEAGLKYRQLARLGFLPIMAISYFLPGVVNVLLWPAVQLMHLGVAVVGGYHLPGVNL
jgi:Zn-dependent protease